MKTEATKELPEINWVPKVELLDNMPDEHQQTFLAKGEDDWGNKYSAISHYSCGDFQELTEIEFAETVQPLKLIWEPRWVSGKEKMEVNYNKRGERLTTIIKEISENMIELYPNPKVYIHTVKEILQKHL